MNNVVRLAIVDPNDATRGTLKSMLLGIDAVWLEAECSRYEFFSDVLEQTKPEIALVAIDSDPDKALLLLSQISQQIPGCAILVVSASQEGSLILQAMRNGAREFLNFPIQLEDFMAALDRIQQTIHKSGKEGGRSKASQVITVCGASGGVGCTALAINLACVLARNPSHSVAVMDLDLALGDADVWLDIIPDYTILDVAENISRLDYSLLKRSLTMHECGAFLLPRPVQMLNENVISPDSLKRVVTLLKATFTHLVIDVSKTYSPLDLAAMKLSDQVLLVSQLDLPCLRNVVRLIQFLDEHEDIKDKLRIVVNRMGLEETQISLNKALETIGREVFWQVPNDYPNMVEARNNGIPLITEAPKAKLTRAIEQLADAVDASFRAGGQGDAAGKGKKGKSLFGFLGSGTK
jgi:pilus assembly protein CpaE